MRRVGLTYDLPFDLLLGQSIVELGLTFDLPSDLLLLSYQLHNVWETNMTFDLLTWIYIGIIYLSWPIYLPSLKLVGQSIVELSVTQGIGDQHDLWPTDLNINRDHLLIKDYLPTKFEASGAKHSLVISCTRYGQSIWPLTYWSEYQ